MKKATNKLRFPPVRKVNHEMAEDALQHLWAISYCDLLMVLLTFFVMYFQFSDISLPKALEKAVKDLQQVEKYGETAKPQGVKGGASPKIGQGIPESLITKLQGAELGIDLVRTDNDVLVNLPNDFYPSGQFKLNMRQKNELSKFLKILKPYSAELSLIFIGHTDTSPMVKKRGHIIDTNLALSTLRAVRAVEYALTEGFDPRWLATQGVGENDRNTRSLSIKLISRVTK